MRLNKVFDFQIFCPRASQKIYELSKCAYGEPKLLPFMLLMSQGQTQIIWITKIRF